MGIFEKSLTGGFDMFFLIKGIRPSVWGTKDINIVGSGLTNVNLQISDHKLNLLKQ